jgi:beta-lactamase class A
MTPEQDDRLAHALEEIAAEVGGVLSVAVRDVRRGRALDLRAAERLPSASVIKVPILVALMEQVERGTVALDERIALRDAVKVPGSGVLSMLHEGLELTVEDLAHLMITVSDNTASNMLIDRIGCEAVNGRMERLGFRSTRLGRKFYDFDARDRGFENWAAAGELADLLVGIENRRVVSEDACEKILAIMRKQQFDRRLPALLPPDTPIANKTGSITGVVHDIGILYAPAGPLVVAALTQGIECAAVAENAIRHVGRVVYEFWGRAAGCGEPATLGAPRTL